MNFADKTTTRKGALGEAIVDRHLKAKGFIPYRPIWEDVAHPFDRLLASLDKRTLLVADTKAKAQRTYWPDTGINFRNYLDYTYVRLRYGLDTYLAFVDERAAEIYGQLLSVLDQRTAIDLRGGQHFYPKNEHTRFGEIRYFPVRSMEKIARLSPDEVMALRGLSTRNSAYDGDAELPF